MKHERTVSIIIPAHDDRDYLEGLLASIERYLQLPFEAVVVDNGSRPRLQTRIESRPWLRWVEADERLYPGVARNLGLAESTGEVIAFLDADVLITEEWASALHSFLEDDSNAQELMLAGDEYDIAKNPSWIDRYWFYYLRFARQRHINGGNIITNRKTMEVLDGFDKSLETGEDFDLCMRLKKAGGEIKISSEWRTHHEGNPASILQFIRRERWHGKSDFISWKRILSSKVALATIVFIALHTIFLVSLFAYIVTGTAAFSFIAALALTGILAIAVLRVLRDIGIHSLKQTVCSTVLSYCYFLGRSLSAYDIAVSKL